MIEFIFNPKFLIPFLSTAGASITIIILQSIHQFHNDRKKKIFAVAYMTDVSLRLLQSSLIIKVNTIIPHIELAKQLIEGNHDLLIKTFLADEFDILTDDAIDFNSLPEEYKILIGYDDIRLLQAFETLIYMHKINKIQNNFNDFVKVNLKSQLDFLSKTKDEQIDILNTYWDYLDKLKHKEDRIIAFILHIFLPMVEEYIKRKFFIMCSKSSIKELLQKANKLKESYKTDIPDPSFFQKSVSGGIQKIIKKKK